MRSSQGYYFRLIHKFMGKYFDRSRALELLTFIGLLVGAALVLLPLAAVFLVSLSPSGVGVKVTGWTFANYQEAWRRGNFLLAFFNSTLVAIAVTGFQVITSALAGYALARLKFRGRQAIVLGVLATLVIPFQLFVAGDVAFGAPCFGDAVFVYVYRGVERFV